MDRTAAIAQKRALRIARHSQPPPILRAIDVLAFERDLGHPEKLRRARNILLRQIDEALLLATSRAARLAFESQSFSHAPLSTPHGRIIFENGPNRLRGAQTDRCGDGSRSFRSRGRLLLLVDEGNHAGNRRHHAGDRCPPCRGAISASHRKIVFAGYTFQVTSGETVLRAVDLRQVTRLVRLSIIRRSASRVTFLAILPEKEVGAFRLQTIPRRSEDHRTLEARSGRKVEIERT